MITKYRGQASRIPWDKMNIKLAESIFQLATSGHTIAGFFAIYFLGARTEYLYMQISPTDCPLSRITYIEVPISATYEYLSIYK